MVRAHKELDVWRHAIALTTAIYRITSTFPAEERFGLASQMRRAAVSVPSNIAEGAARGSDREFHKFLKIAAGSLSELDTQIEIARNLGFVTQEEGDRMRKNIDRIGMMLAGLIKKVRLRIRF